MALVSPPPLFLLCTSTVVVVENLRTRLFCAPISHAGFLWEIQTRSSGKEIKEKNCENSKQGVSGKR